MGERMYRILADYSGRRHDLRVSRHPSESSCYFVAKILAFLLHFEKGLSFSRGLCTGRMPAIYLPAEKGRMKLWVEVGRSCLKKLRQGISRADRVFAYGYGNLEPLMKNLTSISGAERLQVFWLDIAFLEEVAATVSVVTSPWRLSLEGNTIIINGILGVRTRLF